MKMVDLKLALGSLVLVAVATVGCGTGNDKEQVKTTPAPRANPAAGAAPAGYVPRKATAAVTLSGAGATFPAPFYTKAFDSYTKQVDSNVKVNYQAIGSGGGIKNFTEKTVDFGASDAYLTEQQIKDAGGTDNVVLIPTVLGSVVLTWNLPGYNGGLKLSPETVAGIFLGEIKKWNDPAIKAENAGIGLPDAEIGVVYRSDGSGTTNAFTSYLSLVSPKWKDQVGAGTSVKWPTGIGAGGNDGVAGQIKQLPGSIGYVELIYAEQNKLPTAEIKNKAGKYVKPSLDSTAAAAADPAAFKDDLSATLLNTGGDGAYPILTATWLLLYKDYQDDLKGTAIVSLVWWITHEGQTAAQDLHYAPLPKEVAAKVEAKLKTIRAGGKPVIGS